MNQSPPLSGIRVVDFSELLPGPFLSQCLLDLGAHVIKIERPPHGDNARILVPGLYAACNRGKLNRLLDLKDSAQREQALTLVDEADIVIEGFRPGAMKRLGLDYTSICARNPRAIYVSLTGYGQTGPDALLPGHDLNYLAAAGVTALSGRPEDAPEHGFGLPAADLSGALYALASVLAALQQRHSSGRGQWLDVSLTDCLLHMMNPRLGQFAALGKSSLPAQREEVLLRPGYGVFRTADGQDVAIAAIEDHFWRRLVPAIGLVVDEAGTQSYAQRIACASALNRALGERIAQIDSQTLSDALAAADVPCSKVVRPSELSSHPQHVARKTMFSAHTEHGDMTLSRFPVRMEGMPAERDA